MHPESESQRHLQVLRELLSRDYLSRADWSESLRDLASMARAALDGSAALVALISPDGAHWSAISESGQRLDDDAISSRGSRAVLEEVRRTGQPVLSTGDVPLEIDSPSVRVLKVDSVLAVPLHGWDAESRQPERRLVGVLYVHRIQGAAPFTPEDVVLVTDVARIAEPKLNLLLYLGRLESALRETRAEVEAARERERQRFRLGTLETRDPSFARQVLEPLRRMAAADRVGILILGPTGSGKTRLAHAYHCECSRARGPFVTLDCAQVTSSETLGAELFGYAPSSGYANAPARGRPGKALLADGGTLFIDEVSLLSAELQARLLRLIQLGSFTPLGAAEEIRVDVQILAATNEDPARLVSERKFREDLFWRLSECTIQLPALDQRAPDIVPLAEEFLAAAAERYGRAATRGLAADARELLLRHAWSRAGNVRGLEHTLNRSVLFAPQGLELLGAAHIQLQPVREPGAAAEAGRFGARGPEPGGAAAAAERPPRRGQRGAEGEQRLRALLARMIGEHRGILARISTEPELAAALGYARGIVPDSTLSSWIGALGLREELERARSSRARAMSLEEIKAAVLEAGSASIAAGRLGISRDRLIWQLRKAGLTVAEVLQARG